jgi:hypothetical protein
VPNNAFVVIVGDVEHEQIFSWWKSTGSLAACAPAQTAVEPAQTGAPADCQGSGRFAILLMAYKVPVIVMLKTMLIPTHWKCSAQFLTATTPRVSRRS